MPSGGEDAAREFYAGTLGWTEIEKPPVLAGRGGCWFGSDDLEVHLGVEDPFRPALKAHPGILVGDLDAVADGLLASGHEIRHDRDLPGYRRFYVNDPFGNRLEFLQPDVVS